MGPVFISYVRENTDIVDELDQELISHGIGIWRDVRNLGPGVRWKQKIRNAIREGSFFIACFSKEYNNRVKTQMNEELLLAIEELRPRPNDKVWFIPIKLNECEIPSLEISPSETLNDLNHVKLYENRNAGIQSILNTIKPESAENTWDESRINIEIDQRAATEYAKGMACQKEIGLTSHPKEKQQKIQKTLDHYSNALKIHPDYVHALNARGSIYILMEKHDDALKDFTEALHLDPDYFVAYFNRGTLYKTIGKNKDAIEDYGNVIGRRPDIPKTYLSRGEVFLKIGNFTQAIKDYTQTIELESDCFEAYFNRAVAYCEKGVFGLAIKDYTQAIELKPDNGNTYCYRGIVWLHLKNWSEAKSDLTFAQERGIDIITVFNAIHENVSVFEKRNRLKLPEDIASMLTPPQT